VDGDATTDSLRTDIPFYFNLNKGTNCVGPDYVRGGFKYMTLRLPKDPYETGGFWHVGQEGPKRPKKGLLDSIWSRTQQVLGVASAEVDSKAEVSLTGLWVNCTAFPSNPNPRAYTGYFSSSSTLLNRIWYAGAYTLQLSTLDPKEGSALIDYNRGQDHNQSPTGSWYSNFTISNGSAVTTDGAKRDRMVWPGDMSIAAPGIAVSTYDMISVKNALDTIFAHQYGDGSMPYAGPPMGYGGEFSDTYHLHTLLGVYNYILYSGDIQWLKDNWHAYLIALNVSIKKVDHTGLMHVTSGSDWLRPGMSGHALEASAILHDVLHKTIKLTQFLNLDMAEAKKGGSWHHIIYGLAKGINRMYCPSSSLYGDNIEDRNCGGKDEVLPQDGNSWILLSKMLSLPRAVNISFALRSRWTKFGAPAVEYPNVISPFASSFELLGHCAAGAHDIAVELMELMWGYMLDGPGMTNSTCTEGYRVDGYAQYPAYWSPARGSHSHGWSTGPTMILLTEILGIQLTSPLGKTWEIKPHLTKWLGHAQGGYATALGKFEVKLKRMRDEDGESLEVIEIQTPPHTTGTLTFGGRTDTISGGKRLRMGRYAKQYGQDIDWINISDYRWDEMSEEEYEEREVERGGWADTAESRGLWTPDTEWERPQIEEREPGVVDWEALERLYTNKAFIPVHADTGPGYGYGEEL
jgi:hypothetical protein